MDDEGANEADDDDDNDAEDIEAEIKREVEAIRKPKKDALFRAIKIDVQCGKSCHAYDPYPFYPRFELLDVSTTGRTPWRIQ